MRKALFGVVCCAALLLVSCGAISAPETKKESASAAVPVDVGNVGSIGGKIAFTGEKPEPKEISMDATPACARQYTGPVYAEDAIINSNGTLKNAFIYIKDGLAQKVFSPPPAAVRLDQKGCVYSPRVLGVMVGQSLEISNADDTNHNIHPLPRFNAEWNESQPPKGEVKVKTFGNPELPPILFKCNVHPWMRAWVGVVSHPYFAVSSDTGAFTIKDVPPGEYTLVAWHERFGTREVTVKLAPRQAQTADISF